MEKRELQRARDLLVTLLFYFMHCVCVCGVERREKEKRRERERERTDVWLVISLGIATVGARRGRERDYI